MKPVGSKTEDVLVSVDHNGGKVEIYAADNHGDDGMFLSPLEAREVAARIMLASYEAERFVDRWS